MEINSEILDFFEGAEKVFEIWFYKTNKGLRNIPKKEWDNILEIVGATIVSSMKCDKVDSYVLSESSLFVWDDHLVVKTCGQTTLLPAYAHIIRTVGIYSPEAVVAQIFYSHKGFIQSSKQNFPHKSLQQEYLYLNKLFPSGRLYSFEYPQSENSLWIIFTYFNRFIPKNLFIVDDITVEIMMYKLDEKCFKMFSPSSYMDASKEVRMQSGMDNILPNASLDDKIFDPYGYSLNGILKGTYFTIHVTPQPSCSYASFETNLNSPELIDSCLQCLEIFKPKEFCMTVVCHKKSCGTTKALLVKLKNMWKCKKCSCRSINSYHISYAWF